MAGKFLQEVMDNYEYETVHEMIYELLPRGYNVPVAFSEIKDIQDFPAKTKVTIFGYIEKFEIVPMPTSKMLARIKAKLFKDGHSIPLQWTVSKDKARGMLYGLEQKAKNGQLVQVSGKLDEFALFTGAMYRYIEQPLLSGLSDSTEGNNVSVVIPEPQYRLKDGIKINQVMLGFRDLAATFETLDKSDFLPLELEDTLKLQPLLKSIQYVHGLTPIPVPKFNDFLNYDGFRRRIVVEKIWKIMRDGHKSKGIEGDSDFELKEEDIENIKIILSKIHFELTSDQKKAVWGLLKRFSSKKESKNLVFGDVGSGKTMVSIIVSAVLYKKGGQVAIITPTSILAKQHYEEAIQLFPNWNIFLVHSKTTKKEKDKINSVLKTGAPAIVYGTSSVNKLEFTNIVAVFVDEEQKFGVKDKEVLHLKYGIHIVLMTATPIPRTLAGAMFSDFAIHKIEQKPAMQKDRITKIENLKDMSASDINEIKERMKNKEQTLVIVPSIVSNEMASVTSSIEKFGKIFTGFKIDSINGRMKPENIEKTTEKFMAGEIDILIATTMVDAGFSNKMLSHVFIENAERFGIAQLHQIRGRVGRGSLQGYCFLSTTGTLKDTTRDRLNSLVESENGFELSMKDISLRGSGDLTGTEQSGSDVNLIEWLKEIEIIDQYLKNS